MKNGQYELITPPGDYPGKRYRGRYAYEHRVAWWRRTGKNPDNFPGHVVHHKNDQKRDNDPLNVKLIGRSAHSAHHARPVTMRRFVCENCDKVFEKRAEGARVRRFCSRTCIGLFSVKLRRKNKLPSSSGQDAAFSAQ